MVLDIIKRWRVTWLDGDDVEEETFNTLGEAELWASVVQTSDGRSTHIEEMQRAH